MSEQDKKSREALIRVVKQQQAAKGDKNVPHFILRRPTLDASLRRVVNPSSPPSEK